MVSNRVRSAFSARLRGALAARRVQYRGVHGPPAPRRRLAGAPPPRRHYSAAHPHPSNVKVAELSEEVEKHFNASQDYADAKTRLARAMEEVIEVKRMMKESKEISAEAFRKMRKIEKYLKRMDHVQVSSALQIKALADVPYQGKLKKAEWMNDAAEIERMIEMAETYWFEWV